MREGSSPSRDETRRHAVAFAKAEGRGSVERRRDRARRREAARVVETIRGNDEKRGLSCSIARGIDSYLLTGAMNEKRKRLLIELAKIVGNEFYNGSIQNWGPGGVFEGEGRSFRYKLTCATRTVRRTRPGMWTPHCP